LRCAGEGAFEGGELDGVVGGGGGAVGVEQVWRVGGGYLINEVLEHPAVGVGGGEVGGVGAEGVAVDQDDGVGGIVSKGLGRSRKRRWGCRVGFEADGGGGFGHEEAGAVLVERATAYAGLGEDAEALE
jgi:hypothetical protein